MLQASRGSQHLLHSNKGYGIPNIACCDGPVFTLDSISSTIRSCREHYLIGSRFELIGTFFAGGPLELFANLGFARNFLGSLSHHYLNRIPRGNECNQTTVSAGGCLEAKPAFRIGIYPAFVSARRKPTRDKTNYHLVSDESKVRLWTNRADKTSVTGRRIKRALAVGILLWASLLLPIVALILFLRACT